MKIKLTKENVNQGFALGVEIGRCEFLWENDLVDKRISTDSVNKIISMLPTDLEVDRSTFKNFCNSIFDYFIQSSVETYYSILLGMCCLRIHLANSTSNINNFAECIGLAKSCLDMLPQHVIDDREYLFDLLYKHSKNLKDLKDIILKYVL